MKSRVQVLLFVWVGIGALSVVMLQAAPVQGLPLAPMATPTLIPVGTANKTWIPIQRVNAVGVVQVYVPAGCFLMGLNPAVLYRPNAGLFPTASMD